MRSHLIIACLVSFLLVGRVPTQPTKQPKTDNRGFFRGLMHESLAKDKSTFDTIDNLPDYNDWIPVRAMASSSRHVFDTCYWSQNIVIPRLNRVRKILEDVEVKADLRDPVVKRLIEKLEWSAKDFAASEAASREKHIKEILKGDAQYKSEADDCERRLLFGHASAYLLAELRANKALPALARVYRSEERIPVNRIFLFYSMHLLVKDYPTKDASKPLLQLRDDYLAAAKDLPAAVESKVVSWHAGVDEADFRISILRKDIGLDKEPQIRLRNYPAELEKYQDWRGELTEDGRRFLDGLFEKMTPFVEAAFP